MKLIKASIVIAFVVGVLLSKQLWINTGRFLPNLKPFDFVPTLPSPLDTILLLLFIVVCLIWIFYETKIIGFLAIGTLIIILVQDQMRWQPWVYLYLLMLLPYLLRSNHNGDERLILTVLQWIIAGVYLWSGIHKLNQSFLDGTYTQMISATGIKVESQSWKKLGYIIPIIELSMGLALLVPKFRKVAMYTAIVTHIIILFYLSPIVLNHNSVVYPWNIAMIIFVYLLFDNTSEGFLITIREIRSDILSLVPVALVWVFPLLNLFGYWDHYLSFSLYSDKPPKFYIAIENNEIHKINKRYKNYFVNIAGLQGGQIIDIDKWAYSELNVPFYPEERLFKKLISSKFCILNIQDDKLVFLELTSVNRKAHYRKFTCEQ